MSTMEPTNRETLGTGFRDGIMAVMSPGAGLNELRRELRQRNAQRAALLSSLSQSTSRQQRSGSTSSN